MVRLEEYYRTLYAFLRDNTLLCHVGEGRPAPEPRKLEPALIPLTAFLLASKQCVYERVDQFYAEAQKKPASFMGIDDTYETVSVPELERCLTLPGRIIYRKLILLFLERGGKCTERVLRLIKMAYPLSYTEEEAEDLEATLLIGDYDVRNAVITYLVMYLRGITIHRVKENDPVSLVYQQFEQAYRINVPLPFWLPQKNVKPESPSFRLLDIIDTGYMSKLEPWYSDVHQSVAELKKQAEINIKCKVSPLQATAVPTQELIGGLGLLQGAASVVTGKDKSPNIGNRIKKKHRDNSDILPFLYEILSNSLLSREELLDCSISEEINAWVNQAVRRAQAAGTGWSLEEYQILAGIFYTLINRMKNAEDLACFLLLENSPDAVQDQQEQSRKILAEHMSLTQDLVAANKRIEELTQAFKASKEALDKELKQKSKSYDNLNHKYELLKHDFEQLIMVKDEDEENEPDAGGISQEEMKKEIRKKKLLFVGGHPSWQNAMKNEFPGFRFLDPKEYTAATSAVFKGIDLIIYNVNWNNHGMYYKCLKQKGNNSRFVFIRSNNVKRTILNLYRQIEAGEKADVVE